MTTYATRDSGETRAKPAGVPRKTKGAVWIVLFCLSLLLPVILQAGTIRLSPTRILLVATSLPCLIMWVMGKAGPVRSFDIYMLLFVIWSCIAMFVIDGFIESLEPAGIWAIESLGAYLLARCMIRDIASFRLFVRIFAGSVLFLLPFVLAESVLGKPILLNFFRTFAITFPASDMDPRMGLRRAQSVFEHPILYGMFASCAVALAYYTWTHPAKQLWAIMRLVLATIATFLSLSTGAIVAVACQYIMIAWDKVTTQIKHRWRIFGGIVVFFYMLIDALSSRSPAQVFITYLTFNSGSAYNRVLIWKYGTEQVWRTPWFGVGITGEWERAPWMSSSLDNFWLVIPVRFGFLAFLFLAMAVISILRRIGAVEQTEIDKINARKGLLIAIVGLMVGISTVHLWNNAYVFFMFLLGSGVWLLDADERSLAAAKGTKSKTASNSSRSSANAGD